MKSPVFTIKLKDGESAKAIRLDRLRVPFTIALGLLERASEEELHDLITDLNAEVARRQEAGPA